MSTNSTTKEPLVTYSRYLGGHSLFTVWGFLAICGFVVLWINNSMQTPTPYVWPLIPAVIFTVGALVTGIVQTGKGYVNTKNSSENVSSYLRENYDLIVDASEVAVYCDTPLSASEDKIINAKTAAGENVRITMKFSEDLTSITPYFYDAKTTPVQSTRNSDLANV